MTELVRQLPDNFILSHGSHSSFDEGACVMEAVAYVAGEPHSANPQCASPVLAKIAIGINDRYDDAERQLLAPLIPRLVGTRATVEVDRKRSFLMVDASIREIVPMGIEMRWPDLAAKLRAISPIVDTASARSAQKVTAEVRLEADKRPAYAAYAAAYATYDAADAAARPAYAAYAAAYATYDAADAAADAADAAAYAAYDAAAYAAYDAAAAKTPEERARLRSAARRPIVLATIAAFSRAIEVTA